MCRTSRRGRIYCSPKSYLLVATYTYIKYTYSKGSTRMLGWKGMTQGVRKLWLKLRTKPTRWKNFREWKMTHGTICSQTSPKSGSFSTNPSRFQFEVLKINFFVCLGFLAKPWCDSECLLDVIPSFGEKYGTGEHLKWHHRDTISIIQNMSVCVCVCMWNHRKNYTIVNHKRNLQILKKQRDVVNKC